MLWHNAKAELTIIKLDNGYVIKWEREKPKIPHSMMDERGMEIFVKEADLLKRVKELV